MRVAIRVRRSLIMSAVFDTEHEVHFEWYGPARAASWSTATKIVEIAEAGTPKERPKSAEEDRDLLWRWNAYWRYDQMEQGVLVECESITLSRSVPLLLRPVAGPLVSHVARESMDRTLAVFRERFRRNQQAEEARSKKQEAGACLRALAPAADLPMPAQIGDEVVDGFDARPTGGRGRR